jgi:site-specific recombinase XerD
MSDLAPILQSFFTDRMITQRHASPHTIRSYRDTFRLLLTFSQQTTGTPPSGLDVGQLDAGLITAFLRWLDADRSNSPRTRNVRLAAIRSLFRYAALRAPDNAAVIQRVLAIEGSRTDTTLVSWLTDAESNALLAAPDRNSWIGCRDYALLLTALRTGLRVSELIRLACRDLHVGTSAYVRCVGKGRKERCTPVDAQTTAALREWLVEHSGRGRDDDPLFTTRKGNPLSRDAIQARLTKYQQIAIRSCPSLADKNLTPHTLRHSTAMRLRHAGVDNAVIALWLGHHDIRSTQVYTHADLALKEQALDRTTPPDVPHGRYKAPDRLLAFLEAL